MIQVDLTPQFRHVVATEIRYYGVKRLTEKLIGLGYHSSFVNALVRSIMGKEGW